MKPTDLISLSRLIGRVASIQRTCMRLALRDIPGIELEWYYFLHAINAGREVRKTDVISFTLLLEPTTGIDILNRMIRADLLDEHEDPTDRRARLLRLTKKGKLMLIKAEQKVKAVAGLLFGDIPAQLSEPMITPLRHIEEQFGQLLASHRPKTMEQFLQLCAAPTPAKQPS